MQLRTIKAIPDCNEREKSYEATDKEALQQLKSRRKVRSSKLPYTNR